ncbi:hypothetical protein [Archaeoglobus profundus]|uniref:Uncharacterized protein n=1 Tax=Archaeoglobus profundus (strain DSM 5631 / JCM 9629 / NBRC 100127 / Av18) TaxID=572546 RepID=D2RDJ0_ARCPA|nr:hypothetical protein [Archaeoglobus profundus]ADB58184.1 hypothetical protein Arcpr_1126 [Archaeoglobus profundus DSM 5631]
MAWLREVKREKNNRRHNLKVKPSEIIKAYGLGKPIHYTECWYCPLFYRYSYCPYRFWLGTQLYCIRKAVKIDNRLKHGLNL